MNYAIHLKEFNKIDGIILDCRFKKSAASREYIDLAKAGTIKKRDYHIVRSFNNSPWQTAFDFSNSIKNELKTKSRLIKQNVNEEIISSLSNYAIAITDLTFNGASVISFLYENLKKGGCIIVIGEEYSSSQIINVLSSFFDRKFIKLKDGFVILEKSEEVQQPTKINRTRSILT